MKNLILIATRKCNLRCSYCSVAKKNISMNEETARKAVLLFLSSLRRTDKRILIRFFGGEPLLNFSLVKCVVELAKKEAKRRKIKVNFDLTTNGLLLNKEKIAFFKKHPEIELIVSLDGNRETQILNRNNKTGAVDSYGSIFRLKDELLELPGLTVNVVIAPNQVENFFANFAHIRGLGFKRFNFLPAYFVFWPAAGLEILKLEFAKISEFMKRHRGLSVKNAEIKSDLPLFNAGFTVDCDGDIFGSNVILSGHFERLKDSLKTGNVKTARVLKFGGNGDILELMKKNIGDKSLYYSAIKIDKILTNFVRKLKLKNNVYDKKN